VTSGSGAASESEKENELAIRLLFAIATCSIGFSIASSQTLPLQVRQLLDARYPGWQIVKYERPRNTGNPESSIYIDPKARNIIKCHLNLDTIPDYAIRIRVSIASVPYEYFLAAVSTNGTYQLFVLHSTSDLSQTQMFLSPAGRKLNVFGELDSIVTRYGEVSKDGGFIRFPTDCINFTSIIQSSMDLNYVFIQDKFFKISSGD
jgi:hypothetical protein